MSSFLNRYIDRCHSSIMETLIMESDHTPETPTRDWYESDLQLAAELGKTLLEQNKDLEGRLKQCESVIDDQELEIQYLTKQVVALREINDSRLKVYEQLECAIAEQERKNSKLTHESSTDKKLIKSLTSNVEALEKRCEDLTAMIQELTRHEESNKKVNIKGKKDWISNLQHLNSDNKLRRVISCENSIWNYDDYHQQPSAETEVIALQSKVNYMKSIRDQEQNIRKELEVQLSDLVMENEDLKDQLRSCEHKEQQFKNFEYEMQVFEESYGKVCKNCQNRLKLNCCDLDSPTSQLLDSDVETDVGPEIGECTLVRLSNGSVLYGSQESLRSLCNPSIDTCSDAQSISLLSELDAQYKALITKYESLINSQTAEVTEVPEQSSAVVPVVKPAVVESTNKVEDVNMDNSQMSVTETVNVCGPKSSLQVRLHAPPKTLDLNSSGKQIQCHFQRSPPEYKKLFQEIFAVLKKTIECEEEKKAAAAAKAVTESKKEKEVTEVVQCSFGHGAQVTRGKTYAEALLSGKPRGPIRPPSYYRKPNRHSYYK